MSAKWLRQLNSRTNSCGRKTAYPDEASARAAIEAARNRPGLHRRPGTQLTAYRCGLCGQWHFGHSPVKHKPRRRKSA